jgi:hypothetical protein
VHGLAQHHGHARGAAQHQPRNAGQRRINKSAGLSHCIKFGRNYEGKSAMVASENKKFSLRNGIFQRTINFFREKTWVVQKFLLSFGRTLP